MGCQRYPPSSDASKSREHPYEAYTSCQLWSSPAYISFTGASIPALATDVGKPRGYKARNGGEVRESTASRMAGLGDPRLDGGSFNRNEHLSDDSYAFGVPALLNAPSNSPKDRLLFLLGAVTLAIVLGWYTLSYAVFFFRIVIVDPTAYLVASATIPSSGETAFLLLIGWGIQARRRHPPILFLAFVIFEVAGWATWIATSIWLSVSLGGPGFVVLANLFILASALFLLLALALPPRSPSPPWQLPVAPPVGPTP